MTLPVKPGETPKVPRDLVEVRSEGGNFLFAYRVSKHCIELHKRGHVFIIPVLDLIEFGRTSERKVFRVIPESTHLSEGDEVVRQGFE